MTPSLGTLRWTLTGPGAGAGSGVAAIRAPRSLARWSAGTGEGRVLARTPSRMTWMRCPSSRSVTLLRASSGADLDLAPGEVGVPVDVDGPVDLDHGAGRQGGRAGGRGHRGRRAGRGGAAHPQLGQVLGVQAGRHGLDELAADADVDGDLVGPDAGDLPGQGRAHLEPLDPGQHAEHSGGRDHRLELDRRRLTATGPGAGPARRRRAACLPRGRRGRLPVRETPGRNRLAGVAMSSDWCGLAWL